MHYFSSDNTQAQLSSTGHRSRPTLRCQAGLMQRGCHPARDIDDSYAWGETEAKNYHDWTTYILCDGDGNTCFNLGSGIIGTPFDEVHIK